MARPIAPYPISEPYAATLAPLLDELDAGDCFADANDPARWTLGLIRMLNASRLTAQHAGIAQLFIFRLLPIAYTQDRWAILNATRAFGAIDASALTLPSLRTLIQQAALLWQAVTYQRARTRTQLATVLDARKQSAAAESGSHATAFTIFLDRAAEQLTPLLAG